MRVVEREVARLGLRHARAVVGTCVVLRHLYLFTTVNWRDDHRAAPQPGRGLDRVDQSRPLLRPDHDAVDDDLDIVLLVLVEGDRLADLIQASVHPDPHESRLAHVVDQRPVLALATFDNWSEHHHPGALRQLLDVVRHLLDGLPAHLATAYRTVGMSDPRVEQAEVVIDLGDGADRRPRVLRRAFLVDRDRRRQALDDVDVRLFHLPEELAGVGGQGFHVAALALRVDRVEGERRLAGTRKPGEDDKLVARDRKGDVLEVVLARAADRDLVSRHLYEFPGGPSVIPFLSSSQTFRSRSRPNGRPTPRPGT